MSKSGLNEFYGSENQLRAYHGRYVAALAPTPNRASTSIPASACRSLGKAARGH